MKDNQPVTSFSGNKDPNWKIGIVASSFYSEIMEGLVRSATETLISAGIQSNNIKRVDVAGSWEVPLIGSFLAEEKMVDALIGLGIIIEGETQHARLLADQSARGIMDVQLKYNIPFAFEILYVDSINKAEERLDKGEEAAASVLKSLYIINSDEKVRISNLESRSSN